MEPTRLSANVVKKGTYIKLNTARFTKINEGFICEACGMKVPKAKKTCRNHCPSCLRSKHVDIFPGDRNNECGFLMDPIGYEISGKKGLTLIFKCRGCGVKARNIALEDDNYELILTLTPSP